jgi:hypothetical protein
VWHLSINHLSIPSTALGPRQRAPTSLPMLVVGVRPLAKVFIHLKVPMLKEFCRLVWRRLVGARCALTSPKIFRVPYRLPGPILTDPMPPARHASIAPIRFCKKTQRRTTAKQKHRHTVIDPRRATPLTASSTFGIQSVLRECDCIPVVQQSASAYVVREQRRRSQRFRGRIFS